MTKSTPAERESGRFHAKFRAVAAAEDCAARTGIPFAVRLDPHGFGVGPASADLPGAIVHLADPR